MKERWRIGMDPFLFLFIPRSQKLAVKTLQLSNLFQAKFHFRFHHQWLSFLAQAGEVQCFDCKEICACARQIKTLK